MKHFMKLNPEPFEMIKSGRKTIELRLNDEKRQKISTGDTIVFTNAQDNENKIYTRVLNIHSFLSFEQLYKNLPLDKCGYSQDEILNAKSSDMDFYYSKEKQEQYGVLGIEIAVIDNSNLTVNFYESVDDEKLKFAVVISKANGKWVFCKHKKRDTYEIPGGHREDGEDILSTAKRELNEETGAVDFDIKPVCVYSVTRRCGDIDEETFGMLYFADIRTLEENNSEIEKIIITDTLPESWTYPLIQPKLLEQAEKLGII